MALQSPGVQIIERDESLRIPAVTSSVGAIVVAAEKGPLNTPILINNEKQYIDVFGLPNNVNYRHYFTAAAFLGGSDQMWTVRTEDSDILCAGSTVGLSGSALHILPTPKAASYYPLSYDSVGAHEAVDGSTSLLTTELYHVYAVGAGTYYDDVKVAVLTKDDYELLSDFKEELAQAVTMADISAVAYKWYTGTPATTSDPDEGDYLANKPLLRDELIDPSNGYSVDTTLLYGYVSFEFGPLDDTEFATYVWDTEGDLAEKWIVSNDPAHLDNNGNRNFAPLVINRAAGGSSYIRFFVGDDESTAAGVPLYSTGQFNLLAADPLSTNLSNLTGEFSQQWIENFGNKENVIGAIDLLLDPDYADDVKRTLDYIAKELRKDCMALLNIPVNRMINESTGKQISNVYTAMKNYVRGGTDPLGNLNIDSSYSALYGQYFLIYDRFAEQDRWVPVTGYIGRIIAQTDINNAQWWAPAGLNRAIINDVKNIAVMPNSSQNDIIYPVGINPIIRSPDGNSFVVWGQKTLQSKPSAFDRINVRRLFLYMERSIEKMAKYMLFEFNDDFTRSRFRSMANSFLNEIKALRGVTDYKVVCDETNNTAEVIDRNAFVAEILVKPARAVEYIELIFTAVGTAVSFEELVQRR